MEWKESEKFPHETQFYSRWRAKCEYEARSTFMRCEDKNGDGYEVIWVLGVLGMS